MSTKQPDSVNFNSDGTPVKAKYMTLRDYFAAKAMQADISRVGYYKYMKSHARLAYQMADAMLEVRKS